ncbi:uroporphyrinogen-III C-methyltransferase [Ottowia thiooxydans]|uniref:uroporphyrinogen-III C-methyltransferase n=1 Tax=Ottowia thiooxydans TaxID=219182 RepID=UPI000420EB92|nr:uroporphyrinogen-III C-methyltransferase [Ottowia thiooxydans]
MNDEQPLALPTPPPGPTPTPSVSAPAVEIPQSGAPAAPAAPATPPPSPPPPSYMRARRTVVRPGLIVAWALAAAALAASLMLWQKVSAMQEQLARQSGESGARSVEARTLARQAEETVRETAAKVAILDTRIADLSAYRAQLDEAVQSVARTRDENLAVDLEAALNVAQDQTQLTGRIEPLLAALRTAERRVARSGDPRLIPVGRAVARDLERVKSASIPDTAGLLSRLDQLLRQIDELPASNDVGRSRTEKQPVDAAREPATGWWARMSQAVLNEARKLLSVSRIERPDASMMSPEQVFFLRENLKLRLQGAHLAILARQYEAARSNLSAAQFALGAYFDPASRRTQAAATLLQQIQAATKAADLPRVDETLLALGAAVSATATNHISGAK